MKLVTYEVRKHSRVVKLLKLLKSHEKKGLVCNITVDYELSDRTHKLKHNDELKSYYVENDECVCKVSFEKIK